MEKNKSKNIKLIEKNNKKKSLVKNSQGNIN